MCHVEFISPTISDYNWTCLRPNNKDSNFLSSFSWFVLRLPAQFHHLCCRRRQDRLLSPSAWVRAPVLTAVWAPMNCLTCQCLGLLLHKLEALIMPAQQTVMRMWHNGRVARSKHGINIRFCSNTLLQCRVLRANIIWCHVFEPKDFFLNFVFFYSAL